MFPNNNKDDTIVIDNFIYSYALDLPNGIPIKPYYMGKDDNELKYIADKLQAIRNEPDSTTTVDFIDRQFGLTEFYSYLAGGEKSAAGGRKVRKSLIGGPGKPLRASVIVGQPQSPPSPSSSPGRRRLSTGPNQQRNFRPSGKPPFLTPLGMQGSFRGTNQGYSTRNRNNSPQPYMPRTANQFGNRMSTGGYGAQGGYGGFR